jgi:N-formylglutamate amidohydrolase
MCDVDRFVDRLYEPIVKELKLTCVKTQWHRYVIDLNRLPDDVDQDSVIGSPNPPGKFTTGLHWVKTTRGARLMAEPITQALHDQLVQRYFEPFHSDVRDTYDFFREHGADKIYHLDAHSMPSKGTAAHRDPGETRADIVVSDQEGKSCESSYRDLVVSAYEKAGFKVKLNWPYVGGRVTQTYGKPDQGQHTIQVEISRVQYMDEETKQYKPDLAAQLSAKLAQAIRHIHDEMPEIR